MRERAFLNALAGEYDGAAPVSIVLRDDNVLQFSMLGNGARLIPVARHLFSDERPRQAGRGISPQSGGSVDRMAIWRRFRNVGVRAKSKTVNDVIPDGCRYPVTQRFHSQRIRCQTFRPYAQSLAALCTPFTH
jgi:hypothetical protein